MYNLNLNVMSIYETRSIFQQFDCYFLITMDYQNLTTLLPKRSQQWSCSDTSKWLQFINLPNLISIFKQASIDGSCIHLLDDQTLKTQLNITSPIIRKKLLNWVTYGLEGFDKYVGMYQTKMVPQVPCKVPQLKKAHTTSIRNQSKSKLATHSYPNQQSSAGPQSYLMLQQFEGNSLGYHIIKNETMSIGFGKNNNIHSLQASISQKHAIIGYKNSGYFIQDLGSKYGTFVKINQRTLLRYGMILEIGSYQFIVCEIDHINQIIRLKSIYYSGDADSDTQNNKNYFNASTNGIEDKDKNKKVNGKGNNQNLVLMVDLKAKSKYTFGRRKQNDFQRDDKHMSGMHCKITFFNDNFYIQDYGSTNGTWTRISQEYSISAEHPIAHQSIVKLGTAITYICRINQTNALKQMSSKANNKAENDGEMIDENMCRLCGKEESNCLFLPCSHNLCCMECSKSVGNSCFECCHQIGEKIKIHK